MYLKNLAEKIQTRIAQVTGTVIHAVKTADERLFLMKNPPIPAVLVECGFLSNENELKRLKTAEYQQLIAASIWEGINNELRLKKEQKMQIIQSANKQ